MSTARTAFWKTWSGYGTVMLPVQSKKAHSKELPGVVLILPPFRIAQFAVGQFERAGVPARTQQYSFETSQGVRPTASLLLNVC